MDSDSTIEHHNAGVILFREGDKGDRAFIIESGKVEISICSNKSRSVLNILGPGEIFGEMAIIDDAPRSATATVVSDATLRVIRREQLQRRLHKADPVLHMVMRLITSRYRCSTAMFRTSFPVHGEENDPDPRELFGKALAKFRMEAELRGAVENRYLKVRYQPIVDLVARHTVGFEALVRWQHPLKGLLLPPMFVQLAEETDLITALDEYVFNEAVEAILLINRHVPGNGELFVTVNVSAREFGDRSYLKMARQTAHRSGINPQLVKLEITESGVSADANAREWIRAARAEGFGVALDDFGTGLSSLSQLVSLDVDTLKIDQAFVHRLGKFERSKAMMRGIIALAKSMDLSIIAEGIEADEQARVLAQLGCRLGQGFHFGMPVPLEEILSDNSYSLTVPRRP